LCDKEIKIFEKVGFCCNPLREWSNSSKKLATENTKGTEKKRKVSPPKADASELKNPKEYLDAD